MQEVHPLPKFAEILVQLSLVPLYSPVQMPIAGFDSYKHIYSWVLITPLAITACIKKLLLVISSAPENFLKRMSRILSHLADIVCQMDDVLIFKYDRGSLMSDFKLQ